MEVHQDFFSVVLPTLGFQQGIVNVRGRELWAPQLPPEDVSGSCHSVPAVSPQLLGTGRSMNALSHTSQGKNSISHGRLGSWDQLQYQDPV